MVEKYLKSSMCMIPWTGLETRPGGEYKPCCMYRENIKDIQQFKDTMKKMDVIRNENILETFPELAELYEEN